MCVRTYQCVVFEGINMLEGYISSIIWNIMQEE